MSDVILDKLGQEIIEGCIIAYGHALGRCAGIRIGRVVKAEMKYETGWDGKLKVSPRITVQGVDDDWAGRNMELASRKGTLMYPDRIIVLDPEVVPERFLDLLCPVQK